MYTFFGKKIRFILLAKKANPSQDGGAKLRVSNQTAELPNQ